MNMHMDTDNRRAFELVTEALVDIDNYKLRREMAPLHEARDKLEEALKEDPQYLRAHYYAALTDDLIGKSHEAVQRFERVLLAAPSFQEEVHYNLGVAYYHGYGWANLDKAIEHFQLVIETTKSDSLRLLARAGLAQAFAMRMIPRLPESAELEEVRRYYKLSEEQRKLVAVALLGRMKIDAETRTDVEWTMHNARAIALMYYSDYFGTHGEKVRDLGQALTDLEQAEKRSARNWAIYCNIASAHMRMGHWKQESGSARSDPRWDFQKAIDRLRDVIENIRPGYGFALYEMGRTYRLMGDYQHALEYFRKALEVPAGERDVRDPRVNREISLAEANSNQYP